MAYSRTGRNRLSSWSKLDLGEEINGKQDMSVDLKDVRRPGSALLRRASVVPASVKEDSSELWYIGKEDFSKNITQISTKEIYPTTISSSASTTSEAHQPYAIQHVQEKDDLELMKPWQRVAYATSPFFCFGGQCLFWTYLILRTKFTLDAQYKVHRVFPLAWLFLVVECFVAAPLTLNSLWQVAGIKQRSRPQLRLLTNYVPTIDVFVTCCSEDDDLIMDTVRAACTIDYPQDRFRVVVLDDGGSKSLMAKVLLDAEERWPNLFYHARIKIKGQAHHFKAGNLNSGLEYVDALPNGGGEFMAALDADMIPQKDWLRALLPHLLIDAKLGMSCPGQSFYNVPKDDLLCQSLDFFVHVSEGLKDELGVAWCTGSGYCVRRAALSEIGNFPYGSLAEDVCFSSMLLGQGWKCAFVHEPLQFGTVPDSFSSHLKQRTRWAIGTIQTALKLNFCLYGPLCARMTVVQRICGLIYTVSSFFNIFITIALFTIPVVLLSGGTMIAYSETWQLKLLLRVYFADLCLSRIGEFTLFQPAGYYCGRRGGLAQLWMSPYYTLTIIRSFLLPKWAGGSTMAFKPSGSELSDLNERDIRLRAPLLTRLRVMIWNNKVWFHCLQLVACAAGVIYSTVRCSLLGNATRIGGCMISHAAWPPLAWVATMSACWIPLQYTLFPPSMPDREELLVRDKEGIAQPTEAAKRYGSASSVSYGYEVLNVVVCLSTLVLFLLSFYFPDDIVDWRSASTPYTPV